MKYSLVIVTSLVAARIGWSIGITSFSSEGVISFETAHALGTVTVETLCDLNDRKGWTTVGEISITSRTSNITVPVCTGEGYYRLRYSESLPIRDGVGTVRELEPRKALHVSQNGIGVTSAADRTSVKMIPEVTTTDSTESVVVVKAAGSDEYVMLEEARQNIVMHWNILYPQPLVFTNAPGSQADLQDLASALNKMSGQFYRAQ